jgi:hypothetical protein
MEKYGRCTTAPLSPEKYFAALMGIALAEGPFPAHPSTGPKPRHGGQTGKGRQNN